MKIALAIILLLTAAVAVAMGVSVGRVSAPAARVVPPVVMRSIPGHLPKPTAKIEIPGKVPATALKGDVGEKPPVAAKPSEPEAKPADRKPVPVAKPRTEEPIPPAAAEDGPVGRFNLRASDTADVFVDGKKVGGSPVVGHPVKPGKHRVRFDCYDASGESRPGVSQSYEVGADAEKDVEYECPTE